MAERAYCRKHTNRYLPCIECERVADLEARVAALTAALEKYAWHTPTCGCGEDFGRGICTCGLDAALDAARGAK